MSERKGKPSSWIKIKEHGQDGQEVLIFVTPKIPTSEAANIGQLLQRTPELGIKNRSFVLGFKGLTEERVREIIAVHWLPLNSIGVRLEDLNSHPRIKSVKSFEKYLQQKSHTLPS